MKIKIKNCNHDETEFIGFRNTTKPFKLFYIFRCNFCHIDIYWPSSDLPIEFK